MENIIYFLLTGAIAGWPGGQVMQGAGLGIVGNIVVGILGGFIGGYLFDLLGITTSGDLIGGIIVSAVGAIVLLWIARLIKK